MSKKSNTVELDQAQDRQAGASREEIDTALARLQEIAQSLPLVDVVAIVREGRNAGADANS